MRSFILHGPLDLRPGELPTPQPLPDEVLVRVACAGICGSDVHYYRHGRVGSFVPKRPFALGHEFAGVIAETGADVRHWKPGDRVAVDPSQPCGTCRDCRSGRYNLCGGMRYFGSASCDPHLDGAFSEFVAVPARNCHALAASTGWAEAAMLEPLAVALHAARRAGSLGSATVLVEGGGTIGQLVARVARAFGAAHVALADPLPFPRRIALEGGADEVVDPTAGTMPHSARDGFDIVFEAAGSVAALTHAIEATRRGGTIVQVGTLPTEATLPANRIMARELSLVGSFRFANAFEAARALVEGGRIDVLPLVSRRFLFDNTPQAMAVAAAREEVIKVQIHP